MQLDPTLNVGQIRQFASELGKLGHSDVIELERMFTGEKSVDYYMGLLSGYAIGLELVQNAPDGATGTLQKLVAFVADRICKMEP